LEEITDFLMGALFFYGCYSSDILKSVTGSATWDQKENDDKDPSESRVFVSHDQSIIGGEL
jgi:hypothetical protein